MPTFRRDPAAALALSRYREALMRGAPAAELERIASELDPDLVATVQWSLTTGRQARPRPEPRFVSQLRRELLQEFATASTAPLPGPTSRPSRGAQRAGPPSARRFPAREEPREAPITHPRWTWGQLAAAAVLVLVLIGSVLLVRFVTFDRPTTQLGALGAPTTETLVDAVVTGAPEAWTPLAVERWRFQPGATLSIPAVDGPQWIVADNGPIVATVAGEGQSLTPGASLMVPAGQELVLRNPGLAETAIYRGVAAAGFSLEEYDRTLVTQEVGLDTEAHETLPPGESRVVFDRLSIPPGTTQKAESATGKDWFDVVTGELGLTLIGDDLPAGWQSGRERELTADVAVPVLVPGTSVSMHNIGEEPLVLLRLRITPLLDEGSPTANTDSTG